MLPSGSPQKSIFAVSEFQEWLVTYTRPKCYHWVHALDEEDADLPCAEKEGICSVSVVELYSDGGMY